MSKKINISIPNKVKPNLINLFHEYLVRKAKEPIHYASYDDDEYYDMVDYWDRMFPGWDDDLDDNDIVFPPQGNHQIVLKPKQNKKKGRKDTIYDAFWSQEGYGKKGKHKHKNGKKARMVDINTPYSGEEGDYNFDDVGIIDFTSRDDEEYKEIFFYPDYHCKDDKMEFNSIKEFSDYCKEMGYYVPREVVCDIEWRYESHCCLCPESEKIGLLEIMCEHSYGELFFEACEEHELDNCDE